MKERIKAMAWYIVFWVVYFLVARVIFIAYHIEDSKNLTLETIYYIFKNGILMDMSMAGYLSVIPFLLITFANFIKKSRLEYYIFSYTFTFVFLISLIIITDLQVFNVWNYRLDITPIKYLRTPKEAMASMYYVPVFPLILSFIILLVVSTFFVYRKITSVIDSWQHEDNFPYLLPTTFVLTLALIIPMRGGFQLAPMNPSTVYFSNNNFANITAINAPWNFFYSLLYRESPNSNPYQYLPRVKTDAVYRYLLESKVESDFLVKDSIQKPNVLVIITESFTSKIVDGKVGQEPIAPYFNQLKKEGIYFNNIYATGEKTEKGLLGTLSGYPSQPKNSIINNNLKTEKLQSLTKTFSGQQYSTSFFYGGETEFANIKHYLYSSNFDKIVSITDFKKEDLNSKWGAHDHVVLNKAFDELNNVRKPFFSSILTLSNHEPFDVPSPYEYKFGNKNDTLKYFSSAAYTDKALFEFIAKAKKTDWWKNTIVVILADHGSRIPTSEDVSMNFKIPMLWLGGALKDKGIEINKIGSQLDFSKTLLNQLKMPSADFKWSKDIMNRNAKEWAFYVFNDGFGLVKPTGRYAFDNVGKRKIQEFGKVEQRDISQGKAMQQISFQDYLDK